MATHLNFGGAGPLVHLATANGFPPETYRPLAAALTQRHRVLGYRTRPLRPNSPYADLHSWRELAAEMLGEIPAVAGADPLIGVGHSLGGILTLYAAIWQPARFRAVVLIDAVFLPPHVLQWIWLRRKFNAHYPYPLARSASRRRDQFASVAEARERYSGRGVFASFTPAAFEGYLEGGLRPADGGSVTLAWPRMWESRIFALVPFDTWDALNHLKLPLLMIRGSHSDVIIDRSWRRLQRLQPCATFADVPGGHMVPMENPTGVAAAIEDFITTLP